MSASEEEQVSSEADSDSSEEHESSSEENDDASSSEESSSASEQEENGGEIEQGDMDLDRVAEAPAWGVPSGFKPVDTKRGLLDESQLTHQTQLYLFKIPADLDLLQLQGKTLHFAEADSTGRVATLKTENENLWVLEAGAEEARTIVNVVPSRSAGSLRLGRPFARLFHLARPLLLDAPLPEDEPAAEEATAVQKAPPAPLKLRYAPPGAMMAPVPPPIPPHLLAAQPRKYRSPKSVRFDESAIQRSPRTSSHLSPASRKQAPAQSQARQQVQQQQQQQQEQDEEEQKKERKAKKQKSKTTTEDGKEEVAQESPKPVNHKQQQQQADASTTQKREAAKKEPASKQSPHDAPLKRSKAPESPAEEPDTKKQKKKKKKKKEKEQEGAAKALEGAGAHEFKAKHKKRRTAPEDE